MPNAAQGSIVAIEAPGRHIYGLQYHPEVMHTVGGLDTIRHFLFTIAGLTADWTMNEVIEEQLALIAKQVRRRPAPWDCPPACLCPPVRLSGCLSVRLAAHIGGWGALQC
jgi:hypothetical protein